MTDLIKRLRTWNQEATTVTPRIIMNEAANEIESLKHDLDSYIRIAATLATELRDALQWQPIDTAPKDKAVLISNGRYVLKAYWNEDPAIWSFSGPEDSSPCWTVFEAEDYYYSWHLNNNPPTHWMPLPEPSLKEFDPLAHYLDTQIQPSGKKI